jgi:DNA-binding NarL/FixJ family response regulator
LDNIGPITPVRTFRDRDLKKVIVILSESLIGKGVESILSREMDLSVTSISFIDDATLNQQIERVQPDVVILDESLLSSEMPRLFNLFASYPNLRVMVLSVGENRINIYDRQEIQVSHSADLVSAIMGS